MNNLFVTVEGGEGTGKTTVINNIKSYFEDRGFDVVVTREPGGIKISEEIRSVILNTENTEMDAKTEALLYAAARRQHLVQKVMPSLKEGKIVICDRFVDSSLVYQGKARGLGIDNVMSINEFAIDGCMPSLTILLDLKPEVGLARIDADKGREINRLDLESIDFHNKVREGYLEIYEKYRERIVKVDASRSKEEVFESIKAILDEKFPTNEIERKFLVKKELIPEDLLNSESMRIVQKYLEFNPEKRIRLTNYKGNIKATLTTKSDGTLSRCESEKEISLEEFSNLSNNVLGSIIKDRFIYPLEDNLIAEIDFYIEFGNLPKGSGKLPLIVVEVEFETISQANTFKKPIWFGEDITEDSRFKNKNLAIFK